MCVCVCVCVCLLHVPYCVCFGPCYVFVDVGFADLCVCVFLCVKVCF